MAKGKKVIIIAVNILLLLIILAINQYSSFSKKNIYPPREYSQSMLNFYELSLLLVDEDLNAVANLVGVKNLLGLTNNFQFYNQKDYYYTDFTEPIAVTSKFKLMFNFDNQNTGSQLIISGKNNLQDNQWWENIYQLRIGYSNKNLVLSLLNGKKQNSIYYQQIKDIGKDQTFVIEFSDEYASSFSIKNLQGDTLAKVNLLDSLYEMPTGLLPYRSFKIGVNLPPKNGKLTLNKLLLYEF